ncbi:Two-component system sensor histidine kinase [hydrothermal vent metagenome]|uniref:Two-component system sensor histidine kinase n=1 Tax=hydrothermal vent metagenome TaxID=652676 RepID=A0A3B0WUF0_9ZZZZ
MNLALYSYLGASLAYGFLAFLLLFSLRESLQGKLLFVSIFFSACWALSAVRVALHDESYLLAYQSFEIIRYIAWYVFLLKLFDVASSDTKQQGGSYQKFSRKALPLCVGFAVLLLLNEMLASIYALPGQYVLGITGNVLLSLIGLAVVEQLFRNSSARHRWATKYLFLGIGGIFAFDFYLYADALLFRNIDQNLWAARGVAHIVAVPLLAISSARNKNWSLNIFVSRDIILNTSAILAGGFYLLVMAGAGYYLRAYGGDWGQVGQVTFLTLAVVFLFVILTSSQLRAKAKVFLSKHFYKNKYDYRIEWLRLTGDLKINADHENHYKTVIEAMAHIVDARAGALWLCEEKEIYRNVETWQSIRLDNELLSDSSLIRFLSEKKFVINVKELASRENEYENLFLPDWLLETEKPWLIVPLHGVNTLYGFVLLANPLIERSINWEDRDLLKTAAKQITSYLTVLTTSAQLAEAKQFEVFTRLSAYMVHDLKNIAAELNLIAINAKKHTENPEFIADAFDTVENAADDINRLLAQLRNRRAEQEKKTLVNLVEFLAEVMASKKQWLPKPKLKILTESGMILLEKQRFANVLAHLIENAQQATADDGEITVSLSVAENRHIIEIKDNGHGMDDNFIRQRLFKPFDTTKGNAGMGIGMHESREFIRQLGGDIKVQSKLEKGSIITLYLPLDLPHGNDLNMFSA